jgi:2-polyprenyl-6-methoxyphenol hydroxylase-like FAD-dependent oxidoreductase
VTATAREVHDTKISGIVQINASWVVGCDGTHSKVRKAAGIPFEGTPSNLTGMLADIQLTTKPHKFLSSLKDQAQVPC